MPTILILMLQASATIGPPAPVPAIDTRAIREAIRCGATDGEDIVVCAQTDTVEPYRLRPLPPGDYEPRTPLAAFGLFDGGTLALEGDTATFPGGVTSNRAMVRLKMKF